LGARATASSSLVNAVTASTGPKTSRWAIVADGSTRSKTVGG
jgi:hypothetical protein